MIFLKNLSEIIKEDNCVYINDKDGNMVAYVTFPLDSDGVCNINRTFVDGSLRGLGIAKKLMDEAYNVIKEKGYKIRITCSYAVKYFSENPEKKDVFYNEKI